MRRRDLIVIFVGGTALWPLRISAQQSAKMPRIGVLLPGTPESFVSRTKAFLDSLKELGHVEGKTIEIDWKWGQDRVEILSERAAELVRSNVDVIVTGGTTAAKVLKAQTQTIPIVMAIVGDPVASGLADSLARPGGNATGFSIVSPELGAKRLQLLKEIEPKVSSIAVLLNIKNPISQVELERDAACGAGNGTAASSVRSLNRRWIRGCVCENAQRACASPYRSDRSDPVQPKKANRRVRQQEQVARHVLFPRICRGRWLDELRS
jgi:putative ABC transport system substrate-binding protein